MPKDPNSSLAAFDNIEPRFTLIVTNDEAFWFAIAPDGKKYGAKMPPGGPVALRARALMEDALDTVMEIPGMSEPAPPKD